MITKTNKLMLFTGAILFAAAAFIFPADAFAAQGTLLSDQAKQLATQASSIPKLIALGSYVIGTFFAVRALFALKGFIEAPDDNPITKVLSFGAVAALLILLPYIIGVMTATIDAKTQNVTSSAQSFQATGAEGF